MQLCNLPSVVDLEKNTPSRKNKRVTVRFMSMDVRLQSESVVDLTP